MSRNCQHSPSRAIRRRERSRRAWFEALERRDCPAVMFEFIQGDAGGVLRVTGDEGPNVIEIFQPRDGVVEVTGDGEQRTFTDVDEVFVATLGGDDAAHSSKPKEIVVVGSKLHLDVGAGNDRVNVDSAEPDGSILLPRVTWEVSVDLGTGTDDLSMEAGNVDALNLDVRSADGGDRVAVGHRVGLRHEHTRPEARIDMDLAGGRNFVEARLENVEDVDLSIVAEPTPSEPKPEATINVYVHVIRGGSSASSPRMDGVVILSSSLPGGSAIGVSPTSLSFTSTAGGATSPFAASATLDLGSDNDTVSVQSSGVDDVDLNLATGDGNDAVKIVADGLSNTILAGERPPSQINVDLGAGNDNLELQTTDMGNVELDITAGDGNDNVHTQSRVRTIPLWSVQGRTRLGAGDDRLQTEIEGYGNVDTFVDAGPGDDDVATRGTGDRAFFVDESGGFHSVADLGGGNDRYAYDVNGADQARLDLRAGDGDDEVAVHAQANSPFEFIRDARSMGMVIDLGNGANQLLVDTSCFADVTQDFRAGSGNDQIVVSDRAGPFFQFDSKRLRQEIYTGGGNDIVLDDTAGSDDVRASIDTGHGDDIAFVFTRIDTSARQASFVIELSLGAGRDLALLDTVGYSQISAAIDTGPAGDGRDVVLASFRLSPLERTRRIRRLDDGGLDLFELQVGAGYDIQTTSRETTIYVLIGTPSPR
jgi:hypothetical protein